MDFIPIIMEIFPLLNHLPPSLSLLYPLTIFHRIGFAPAGSGSAHSSLHDSRPLEFRKRCQWPAKFSDSKVPTSLDMLWLKLQSVVWFTYFTSFLDPSESRNFGRVHSSHFLHEALQKTENRQIHASNATLSIYPFSTEVVGSFYRTSIGTSGSTFCVNFYRFTSPCSSSTSSLERFRGIYREVRQICQGLMALRRLVQPVS